MIFIWGKNHFLNPHVMKLKCHCAPPKNRCVYCEFFVFFFLSLLIFKSFLLFESTFFCSCHLPCDDKFCFEKNRSICLQTYCQQYEFKCCINTATAAATAGEYMHFEIHFTFNSNCCCKRMRWSARKTPKDVVSNVRVYITS